MAHCLQSNTLSPLIFVSFFPFSFCFSTFFFFYSSILFSQVFDVHSCLQLTLAPPRNFKMNAMSL